MSKDEALDLALEALEYFSDTSPTMAGKAHAEDAITAIKQALAAPVQEPVAFYRCNGCGHAYEQVHPTSCDCMEAGGFDRVEYYTTPPAAQPAPVQEPVDTLIAAWQALEETSGHVLDVADVEGRMHISVIRSAWEQMDSLVRAMWDERGRP
jgi:hypothetical protein